jgi:D-alanyl-D-alanine carboxypeptidase (penicillin-binding protein 5/6)
MAEGASLSGYRSGDELTIEDLAYGIVLPSGGDAALVAANYVAGSEKAFVEKMNQLAKELKMINTHFKNSTGLDARNHYSTVEDLSNNNNVSNRWNNLYTRRLLYREYNVKRFSRFKYCQWPNFRWKNRIH